MKEVAKFQLDEETIGILVILRSNREALCALNKQMISIGDLDSERYRSFVKECDDARTDWESALDNTVKQFAPDYYGKPYKFNIDFINEALVILSE